MTNDLTPAATPDRSVLRHWLVPVLLVAGLALASCGSDDSTTAGSDPTMTTSDQATTTTAPTTVPTSTGSTGIEPPATTTPSDTPLSVAEALEIGDDNLHQVAGFVVTVDQIPHLCAALAESDPPQCGEPSIALAGEPTSNLSDLFDNLTTRNRVSWTPTPVTVTGAVITTGPNPELWVTP
jgi:hypothetical protein